MDCECLCRLSGFQTVSLSRIFRSLVRRRSSRIERRLVGNALFRSAHLVQKLLSSPLSNSFCRNTLRGKRLNLLNAGSRKALHFAIRLFLLPPALAGGYG